MSLHGNEKILEVGCGGGNLSRFLSKKLPKGKLVCIDNSKYWIDKARKRLRNFENVELLIKNVLNLKRKNYFDIIVLHFVLHDISKRKRTINILKNSLKKKGLIYIAELIRKSHGMNSNEIKRLMTQEEFLENYSKEEIVFPIRGQVYYEVFKKR